MPPTRRESVAPHPLHDTHPLTPHPLPTTIRTTNRTQREPPPSLERTAMETQARPPQALRLLLACFLAVIRTHSTLVSATAQLRPLDTFDTSQIQNTFFSYGKCRIVEPEKVPHPAQGSVTFSDTKKCHTLFVAGQLRKCHKCHNSPKICDIFSYEKCHTLIVSGPARKMSQMSHFSATKNKF